MKKIKSFVSILLVGMLVLASPINSLAGPKSGGSKGGSSKSSSSKSSNSSTSKTESVSTEKKSSKSESNNIEKSNQSNEKQSSNKELKTSMKQLKEAAKKTYSQEELTKLQESVNEIKESYPGIKTIPVENIISKRMNMKFDTPPVIKEGRTLIPVRALTQAFGAQVSWSPEEKKVTIVKDGVEMTLQIDSNTAYVNGEEVQLDVPAEIMNSRTVVPLRFIVEKMGLKVNWDEESETIEIGDTEETTDEDNAINPDDGQAVEEPAQEEGQTVENPVQEEQQTQEVQPDSQVKDANNDTTQETNNQTTEQTNTDSSNAI